MARKFRIFQYSLFDLGKAGGVEAHIDQVSKELRLRGHTCEIGSSQKEIEAFAPDFILSHANRPLPKRLKRAPYIHVFHGTSVGRLLNCGEYLGLTGWRASAKELVAAQLADAAVTVSQMVSNEIRRYFFFKKPICVIPNGIEAKLFPRAERLSEAPRFLIVGRLDDQVKNFELLIKAADALLPEIPNLEVLATGIGSVRRPYLKDIGGADRETLSGFFRESKALVLPSHYESDGIVAREAQATGIYAIASDLPALHENLDGYAGALFIDPKSVDSLKTAMAAVAQSKTTAPFQPRIRSWSEVAADFERNFEALARA